ncbi:MAG TPA: hypothetical protein VHT52_11935 [Stellaceae bacterium]|jgi:hypothetical protein|nr:hypothetical protein [Stellaceae bacterium]
MTDTRTFEDWVLDNPPPNLTELVERFGGFSRVPVEEWAKYDKAYRQWDNERVTRFQK